MTTNKKILIGLGIGLGVYAIFIHKGFLDGLTIWEKYTRKPYKPKEQTEPKTNADGVSQLKVYAPPAVSVAVPMFKAIPLGQNRNGILMVDPANA